MIKENNTWILTNEETLQIAKNTNRLKSQLKKLSLERDAYKKAYEDTIILNEQISDSINKLYIKINEKDEYYNDMLNNYAEEVNLLKKENRRLKRGKNFWNTTTILIGIGGILALCR